VQGVEDLRQNQVIVILKTMRVNEFACKTFRVYLNEAKFRINLGTSLEPGLEVEIRGRVMYSDLSTRATRFIEVLVG
jgi:hypothetical protein